MNGLLAADVNCTDMADENCTLVQIVVFTDRCGDGVVREGASSVATTLSGAGIRQDGVGTEVRGEPTHRLSLDRDGTMSPSLSAQIVSPLVTVSIDSFAFIEEKKLTLI